MKANTLQVRNLLKYTFGLVPIIAGLDKFSNLLTDWGKYIPEGIQEILPVSAGTLLISIGIVEIIAGGLVLTKTRIGALVVALWLVIIALVLLIDGNYLDVAVRDLVMAIAAFSLYKLSET